MASRGIYFFAEKEDVEPLLKEFESSNDVHYYETGMFLDRDSPHFNSYTDMGELGKVSNGNWLFNPSYLIMPSDTLMEIRQVAQIEGGFRYFVDQQVNPKSIIYKGSGIYQEGIFVMGSLSTISEDEFSLGCFKQLSTLTKKNFIKIKGEYIGKSAMTKLKDGWRFVQDYRSPKEYDLQV